MKPFVAALLALAAGGAALAQAPAIDRPTNEGALATVIAANVSQTLAQLDSLGVEIDPVRFRALLAAALRGENVGFESASEAGGWLADASLPPAITPADAAAEMAWVESKRALPRAEALEGGTVMQRLVDGSGVQPGPESTVMVNYTGRLSSGRVFDQTTEPFAMPVGHVVPGLRRALQQMRVGGTYRVFIPPAEAYGTRTIMDLIPANSALEFEIEILGLR